jgi:hypothetical protein
VVPGTRVFGSLDGVESGKKVCWVKVFGCGPASTKFTFPGEQQQEQECLPAARAGACRELHSSHAKGKRRPEYGCSIMALTTTRATHDTVVSQALINDYMFKQPQVLLVPSRVQRRLERSARDSYHRSKRTYTRSTVMVVSRSSCSLRRQHGTSLSHCY